jgi:hypothetical protein
VLDRVASRLELARAFGADHALSLADLTTPERRIQAVMISPAGLAPTSWPTSSATPTYLEVGAIAPGNVFSYDATALVRGNARLVATSNYSPWALAQRISRAALSMAS